jgi:hypothetical protein
MVKIHCQGRRVYTFGLRVLNKGLTVWGLGFKISDLWIMVLSFGGSIFGVLRLSVWKQGICEKGDQGWG